MPFLIWTFVSFRSQGGPEYLNYDEGQFARAVCDRIWRRAQCDKSAPHKHPIFTRKAVVKMFADIDEYSLKIHGYRVTQLPKNGKKLSASKLQRDRYMLLNLRC